MPSTYSDLKIELIATGEESGTWGITTNTNLGTALEEAIVGRATANFTTDADLTISLTDTNATQVARNYILNVTSGVSLTTTRNLIVPTIDKPYIVENNTTGSQSIVVKTSAGTGVTVPNGKSMMVYANSTNVVPAFTDLPSTTTLGGNGIVTGPASSTDNAIARFDGTTGKLVQNSAVTIDDTSGDITGGKYNKVTITAPATGATLTIADGKTATVNNSITFAGTDSTTMTFPAISASVGYKNVPAVGTKTSAYTLTTADVGKYVQVGASGSIEIPDSVFAEGDAINIFNNTSGAITITCTITTAYIAGTDADKATVSLATRGLATILFISGTVCVITGNVS